MTSKAGNTAKPRKAATKATSPAALDINVAQAATPPSIPVVVNAESSGVSAGLVSTAPAQAESRSSQTAAPLAIWVTSKPESFRRAGRQFSRIPVKITLAELDEGQLALLQDEPMLAISNVEPGQ